MPVCAQEEELQMGVTATVDDTELTFWQEGTKMEDGEMYADYVLFDENGAERYKLRIVVKAGIPEGFYKKTSGTGSDPRFLFSLITDPASGVDSAYCLSNYETEYIRNSSYELTVTESDSLSGRYHGTFEGTAVLWKGTAQVEITDAEFDIVANSTSPNYGNGGGAVSDRNDGAKIGSGDGTSGGNTVAADSNACTRCDGSGICSNCGGTGEDLCSCLGGSCPTCSGIGHKMVYTSDGLEFRDCRTCGGTGFHERCGGTGFLECTRCDGTGICTYCNGTGER